jgi:hypothetical protein
MNFNLRPRIAAEFLGTGFLLMAIVGSGSWPSASKATGASLVALILAFGTISGALFNLAVTLAEAMLGGIAWREALAYVVAQVAGGLCGVGVAHLMFGLPFFFASHHVRSGGVLGGERIRCHVRAAGRDLGLLVWLSLRHTLRSWRLYYRGVLDHFVHIVRKPSGDPGASSNRRSGVHRRTTRRNIGCVLMGATVTPHQSGEG